MPIGQPRDFATARNKSDVGRWRMQRQRRRFDDGELSAASHEIIPRRFQKLNVRFSCMQTIPLDAETISSPLRPRHPLLALETAHNALANSAILQQDVLKSLKRAAKDNDAVVRETAISCLSRIGTSDSEFLSILEEVLLTDSDQSVAISAVFGLGSMRDRGIAGIGRATNHSEPYVQLAALNQLLGIWRNGRPSKNGVGLVPHLINVLLDSRDESGANAEIRDESRATAASILREMGPSAQEAIPALLHCMSDRNTHLRAMAMLALGEIGPGAEVAADVLMMAMQEPDSEVRTAAAISYSKLNPENRAAIMVLEESLAAPEFYIRNIAIDRLFEMACNDADIFAELTVLSTRGDPESKKNAAFIVQSVAESKSNKD